MTDQKNPSPPKPVCGRCYCRFCRCTAIYGLWVWDRPGYSKGGKR